MLNTKKSEVLFAELHVKAKEGGTPATSSPEFYENGTIPFVKIDDLSQKYITSTTEKITQAGLDNSSAWIIPVNSVLFSNGATIGSTSINKIEVATKQGILGIVPKANNEYFYYLLNTQDFLKEVKKRTTKGTFDAVYITEINKIKVKVHKAEEQVKIGSFLSAIDRLIVKQKEKVDQIKSLKKGYLQKMFPADGEDIPQIRFKGFSGNWTEKVLSDVSYYRNGKAHENDIVSLGKYTVVNSKFVSTNGKVKKYTNSLIEPLNVGEIAFVLSDLPDGKALATTFLIDVSDKYSLNQRIAAITPKSDSNHNFLYYLLNRNSYFLSFNDGVNQTNLTRKQVEEFSSHYPNQKEQEKIGSFLSTIDRLIEKEEATAERYESLKKGYLQKIFAD
jgi:type I restriction enzyme S subunit